MDTQLSQSKLVLLYIIREKDSITPKELADFVLFREYMDYFSMQTYLAELVESELVLEIRRDDTLYYMLHPRGIEVVELFRARIPHSIREEIRVYALNSTQNEATMLSAVSVQEETDKNILITCRIMDYDQVKMELKMGAYDEAQATAIRSNWQEKGLSIYWNMLKEIGNQKGDLTKC